MYSKFSKAYDFEIDAIWKLLSNAYPDVPMSKYSVSRMVWRFTSDHNYIPPVDACY